ncbi:hypothetical protein GGI04_002120 [Coemansia thaxteri]|uniref:Uncharacterized protein n=1 Tax=Coemansia thaxteri TaxID=2663907 RepID=A0A9W8BFJ3_9FUNG|nr:hypothetical protein H4R26_002105 [Coemansia thaxteri]KAJ2005753.1 hypothetical protein GGI04_002120 [Coemansia thaxteri]
MRRDLFGGAMSIDLCDDMVDVSEIRQVPDNQEVFVSTNSDDSVIIEILEGVDEADGFDALRFHYAQVADLNDDPDSGIQRTQAVAIASQPGTAFLAEGRQHAANTAPTFCSR